MSSGSTDRPRPVRTTSRAPDPGSSQARARAAAAAARTSAGTTTRVVDARESTAEATSSARRGRSTTTRSCERTPASRTDTTADAGRVHRIAAVPRHDADAPRAGQRIAEDGAGHGAGQAGEVGPAQARDVLGAHQQVRATAPRVGVDEQRAAARPHRCQAERGGEDRRAGPAPAADDGDHRPAGVAALGGSHRLDQPALALGQQHHPLGAEGHGVAPEQRVLLVGAHTDEDDVPAARQADLGQRRREIAADEHQRRGLPHRTGRARMRSDVGLHARTRRQTQQVLEQGRVRCHEQRAVTPGQQVGHGGSRRRYRHDRGLPRPRAGGPAGAVDQRIRAPGCGRRARTSRTATAPGRDRQ